MQRSLLRSILPYVIGLCVAAGFFVYIGRLEYTSRPGQLGPETWPRLALLLMGASCLFEIGRRLLVGNRSATGFIEAFDRESESEERQPSHPGLIIGGILLMGIYAVLLPILGFLVATFLFLAAFMYVGRYRAHGVIWATSAAVTVLCGMLFLRIAYVSLPRGIAPFDRVTDMFFAIPGL